MTATAPAAEVAALDAVAQAALVRAGEVTAGRAHRVGDRAHRALNPTLNAVVTPTYEQALCGRARRCRRTRRWPASRSCSRT